MMEAGQRLVTGKTRKWSGRDHASKAYERAARMAVEDRAVMAPMSLSEQRSFREELQARRTTSFAKRISTHSELNSHTSKKRTLTASVRATASSGEAMLKRSTTSPPYLASRVDGGALDPDAVAFAPESLVCSLQGIDQMLRMRPSRSREKIDLVGIGCW